VIGQQLNDKTGRLIGAIVVDDSHEIMLISEKGVLIRTRAAEVRIAGRNTQGVRLMRPDEGDRLVGVDRVEVEAEETNGNGGDSAIEGSAGDAAPK
jgi:DNA gyrase subunit A